MKTISGFKSQRSRAGFPQLPAGCYVAQIKRAFIEGNPPQQFLILRVDVSEGENAGYYTKRWKHDQDTSTGKYPIKYKGDFKLRVPDESNSYPESDLGKMQDAIAKIEESNPGYHWNWDENSLVNLYIGINVQPGEYNGIYFTKIGGLESVDDVRSGKAVPMKAREQKGDAADPPVDRISGMAVVETDSLPF